MNYTHLTEDERYQIYESLAANVSQVDIAKLLGRSTLTISENCSVTGISVAIAHDRHKGKPLLGAMSVKMAGKYPMIYGKKSTLA